MAYRVTVAAITFNDPFFRSPFEAPLDLAYSERPKAELEIEDTATMKSVFELAIQELRVTVDQPDCLDEFSPADNLAFTAFYDRDDDNGFAEHRHFMNLWDLAVVDESGLIQWSQEYTTVPYEALVRTADAGLLGGDPARPYLILNSPEGNGVLLTWEGVLAAYLILKGLLAVASDVEGTLAFRDRLRERLRRTERAEEAVRENSPAWASRGARPDNFTEMLERGNPWSSVDLAERLDTSVDGAEAILGGFGFSQDASGLWRLDDDEDASFMRGALDEAVVWVGSGGEPGRQFEERVETYVETGERPPFPWEEGGDYEY